jgi:hypothetical protein
MLGKIKTQHEIQGVLGPIVCYCLIFVFWCVNFCDSTCASSKHKARMILWILLLCWVCLERNEI